MNHQGVDDPSCPFCPFSDLDSNFVSEHIQFCHPENEAQHAFNSDLTVAATTSEEQMPPLINEDEDHQNSNGWQDQHEDRGMQELNTRFDLDTAQPHKHGNKSSLQLDPRNHLPDDMMLEEHLFINHKISKNESFSRVFPRNDKMSEQASSAEPAGGIKRLGRAELGPYAHEKQMPSWLRSALEKGVKTTKLNQIGSDGKIRKQETAENQAIDVIPVLARLCEQDKSVQRAFLCSPEVHHISKMPLEGGFCGYRNIQMLVSYIRETRGLEHDHFSSGLPTILHLQDMIEQAWDMGFNSVARTETGGIRGTRKYIGTPEAQALFLSLGIQCEASSIGNTKEIPAHDALLTQIATYFRAACSTEERVVQTNLPPIYFQHQGHSMTIIGFEIRDQGKANLLVFDPIYKTPAAIKRLHGARPVSSDPSRLLKGYRKGVTYLQKYKAFELLKLNVPAAKYVN